MALKLHGMKDTFEVVVSADPALDMTPEEYEQYIKTCDPQYLKIKDGEQPTRFLLRRVLPNHLSAKVQSLIKYKPAKGAEGVDVDFFAYIREEVRCSLAGIINPEGCEEPIEFAVATDGGASEDLIAMLGEAGALMDLFNARQQKQTKKVDKKK